MDALTIYAYFNAAELAALFDAVAALTASSNFNGMLRMCATIGLISMVVAAAMARHGDPAEYLRWFLTIVLVQGVLVVPKLTVVIVDRTGSAPPQVRAGIPLGLAVLASASSSIGDALTRATETVMALPDDLQFQRHGLMFGNAVLVDTLQAGAPSAVFREDLTRFINHCTYYDLLAGRVDAAAFGSEPNLWSLMAVTSRALLVPLKGNPKGSLPCNEAYQDLDRRWSAELAQVMGTRGRLLNPEVQNQALARSLLASQIGSSYAQLTGIAEDATALLRQAIAINAVRDSQMVAAQRLDSASAAIVGAAQAQAELAANQQYLAMARIAERATPRLRNVIETICYAVFPIIVMLMLVNVERAGRLLKAWGLTLAWLQLIPPLYAILNFGMTRAGSTNLRAIADQGGAPAMTLNNLGQLAQQGLSEMAMAGYLSLLLPLIAWALVKSGEIGGNALFAAIMGPATGAASTASNSLAAGNISQNNVSLDTASRNNLNANHYDSAPSFASGFARVQGAAGTALYGNDGQFRFQGNQSVLGLSASFGEKLGNTILQEARESEGLAKRHTVSAGEHRASGIAERLNLVHNYSEHNGLHNASEIARGSRSAQTLADMNQIAEQVNKRLGLTADSGAGRQIVSSLSTGIEINPKLPMLSGKIGLSGDQIKSVEERKALQGAIDFARNELKSKGITTENAASDEFRDSEAYQWGRQHRVESLRSSDESISKSRQYQRNAELARSDAESMSRQASIVNDSWLHSSMQYEGYIASRLQQEGMLDHFGRLYESNPDAAYRLAARYLRETSFDALPTRSAVTNDLESLKEHTAGIRRSEAKRQELLGEPIDNTANALTNRNRLAEGSPVVQRGHEIVKQVLQTIENIGGEINSQKNQTQDLFTTRKGDASKQLSRTQPEDRNVPPVPQKGTPGHIQQELHNDLLKDEGRSKK